MPKKNEQFTGEITGYTSEGLGVARAPDGMTVFVRDAIAGEKAVVAIAEARATVDGQDAVTAELTFALAQNG